MKVKNVQPRLIRIGGQFITPGEIADIDESAVGLSSLLARGVLVEVKSEPEQGDKKGAVEQDEPTQGDKAQPTGHKNEQSDKSKRDKGKQSDAPEAETTE